MMRLGEGRKTLNHGGTECAEKSHYYCLLPKKLRALCVSVVNYLSKEVW